MTTGVVAPETAGAPPHGVASVEMSAHKDAEPGTGAAAALFRDLQADAVEGGVPHAILKLR